MSARNARGQSPQSPAGAAVAAASAAAAQRLGERIAAEGLADVSYASIDSPLGARYVGDMDRLFDAYRELLPVLQAWFAAQYPKAPRDSDFVWRQSVRAKAFDALRGVLPAAATPVESRAMLV